MRRPGHRPLGVHVPATGWTPGACAHDGRFDDRESMWVDNNPSSPHYGRMYISWNDFAGRRFTRRRDL
jgi:hypothetical protein